MKKLSYLLLVASLTIISCAKPDTDSNNNPTSGPAYVIPDSLTTVYDLINDVREHGCYCGTDYYPPVSALSVDSRIEQAALIHSQDMQTQGYFGHTGSDGTTVAERLTAVGYIWWAAGENIASGQPTERDAFHDWLYSPSHCHNIMSPEYEDMGMGRVNNLWTFDFGKD